MRPHSFEGLTETRAAFSRDRGLLLVVLSKTFGSARRFNQAEVKESESRLNKKTDAAH